MRQRLISAALAGRTPIHYPGVLTLLVACTVIGALSFTRLRLIGAFTGTQPGFWPGVVLWQVCFLPWALAAPAAFRLERLFPLTRERWLRSVASLFLPGLVLAYFCYQASTVLAIVLVRVFPGSSWDPHLSWSIPPSELALHQWGFWATVAVGCIIRNLIQLYEQEQQTARLALDKSKLEASLTRAELETLRMRIKPHFLFNTLQNISVLVEHEPRTAKRMLASLGDLLRTAFQRGQHPEVTLEEEMGLTRHYLELERMRFGDRLSVRIDMEPGSGEALVPSLLLQPLVENAIVHGLRGARRSGEIRIRALVEAGHLTLIVTDNGSGIAGGTLRAADLGVGLGSTTERLARMYPEQHELTIRSLDEGGTEVRIMLPLRLPSVQQAENYELPQVVNR